jgi:REP element-mobilizing transposase RayT
VVLDEWVVMPNHVHGILVITDSASTVGATQWFAPTSAAPTTPASPSGPLPGSIGAIVGQFKSIVTKRINLLRGITAPPVWQRNYYEHIVRNETALNAIRQYIRQNPVKWALDRDNDAIGQPMA